MLKSSFDYSPLHSQLLIRKLMKKHNTCSETSPYIGPHGGTLPACGGRLHEGYISKYAIFARGVLLRRRPAAVVDPSPGCLREAGNTLGNEQHEEARVFDPYWPPIAIATATSYSRAGVRVSSCLRLLRLSFLIVIGRRQHPIAPKVNRRRRGSGPRSAAP